MDWEAPGVVAELIGAVGVVASLFYLAHQIRRNSSALEAATNQARTGTGPILCSSDVSRN